MVLASGWQVNLPRRSSIPFQKFSHGFPLYFPQLYCISCTISHPFLRCTLPVPVRLFPSYPSLFCMTRGYTLRFYRFPSLKMQNARRQLPARRTKGCSRFLVVVFWTGGHRLVAPPLDHRPVGRPMIRRQRNPPRSGWPTSRRYEPRQRGANPPEIPARLGQKWASPSPGLDSPRQVGYTTPQKTFAWIFPDETNSYPFRHTALSAVWRFLSTGAPRHLPPRR